MVGCGEKARAGEVRGAIASVGGYSPKALPGGALGIISEGRFLSHKESEWTPYKGGLVRRWLNRDW